MIGLRLVAEEAIAQIEHRTPTEEIHRRHTGDYLGIETLAVTHRLDMMHELVKRGIKRIDYSYLM